MGPIPSSPVPSHTPHTIHHTPHTIPHTPYTIHHTPHTILHTPYTMHHTPYTIHHTPYTIHHAPYTITPYAIHHTPIAAPPIAAPPGPGPILASFFFPFIFFSFMVSLEKLGHVTHFIKEIENALPVSRGPPPPPLYQNPRLPHPLQPAASNSLPGPRGTAPAAGGVPGASESGSGTENGAEIGLNFGRETGSHALGTVR